jgi:hypothetical protein
MAKISLKSESAELKPVTIRLKLYKKADKLATSMGITEELYDLAGKSQDLIYLLRSSESPETLGLHCTSQRYSSTKVTKQNSKKASIGDRALNQVQ